MRNSTLPGQPDTKRCTRCRILKPNDFEQFCSVDTAQGKATVNVCRECTSKLRQKNYLERLARDRAFRAAAKAGKT